MEADNKDRRQGSVISPLFANVYLHYVFDLWAERWRRREAATGTMVMTRYADGCPVLFGGFVATMTESDFSCSYIIGFGSSPSQCGPVGFSACGRA